MNVVFSVLVVGLLGVINGEERLVGGVMGGSEPIVFVLLVPVNCARRPIRGEVGDAG